MSDKKTKTKIVWVLLGIDCSLFLLSIGLLVITVYLPNVLLDKPGLKLYLVSVFFFFLILVVLGVIGVSLIGILADKGKKIEREYHEEKIKNID